VQPIGGTPRRMVVADDAPEKWQDAYDVREFCPYGVAGDVLWVRENFTYWERRESDRELKPGESRDYQKPQGFAKLLERIQHEGEDYIKYLADGAVRSLAEWAHPHPIYEHCVGRFGRVMPSIFMPRWASRISLRVVSVRVERLQDISESDAKAEGVESDLDDMRKLSHLRGSEAARAVPTVLESSRSRFRYLWDSINGKRAPWSSNPWVWRIEFEHVKATQEQVR